MQKVKKIPQRQCVGCPQRLALQGVGGWQRPHQQDQGAEESKQFFLHGICLQKYRLWLILAPLRRGCKRLFPICRMPGCPAESLAGEYRL